MLTTQAALVQSPPSDAREAPKKKNSCRAPERVADHSTRLIHATHRHNRLMATISKPNHRPVNMMIPPHHPRPLVDVGDTLKPRVLGDGKAPFHAACSSGQMSVTFTP